MIVDVAVEQVAFVCRHCGHEWRADYDVTHYEESDGTTFRYFALDGQPVPSPYVPSSTLCPVCRQPATLGHLVARRSIPLPDQNSDQPRDRVDDPAGLRAS
jgi:hypothetical protein